MDSSDLLFEKGERCKIRGRSGDLNLGQVAFVGQVHYAKGTFVGIVLDEQVRRR
jgi:hypothetical protein